MSMTKRMLEDMYEYMPDEDMSTYFDEMIQYFDQNDTEWYESEQYESAEEAYADRILSSLDWSEYE